MIRIAAVSNHNRAAATGAEPWRKGLNGTAPGDFEEALAMTVDNAGDVVAAGTINGFFIIKLNGADGNNLAPIEASRTELNE